MQVVSADEVEAFLAGVEGGKIGLLPADPLADGRVVLVRGMGSCPGERDLGDVQAHHAPAATGQPDGIGAFARTDVEGHTRHQIGSFGDELGLGRPLQSAVRVR